MSLGMLHIWIRTQVVTLNYQLNQDIKKSLALEKEYVKLSLQYTNMVSHNSLEKYLNSSVNDFREASTEQVIFVRKEAGALR